MKHRLFTLLVLMLSCSYIKAQTYIHNEDYMQQLLYVQTGAGSLQPRWYYNTLPHLRKFSRKAEYRVGLSVKRTTVNGLMLKETEKATIVDSAMNREATHEAKVVLDRSTMTDEAWMIEKNKIESMLYTFQRNINKITMYGGTRQTYKMWLNTYNMLQTAINETRKSYQNSGNKKKQYITIYEELVSNNNNLVLTLRKLNRNKKVNNFLEVKDNIPKFGSSQTAAHDAKQRWVNSLIITKGLDH